MPRNRKPTKLLEISGRFKHDPQRKAARANEPIDLEELIGPPEYFTGDQKLAWDYIVECAPSGVLHKPDAPAIELAAKLYAEQRAGTMDTQRLAQLIRLLGQFGMTPSERSKVSAVQRKKENKFAVI